MDINRETPATLEAYGAKPGESSFANNCLLARLAEQLRLNAGVTYNLSWKTRLEEVIRDVANSHFSFSSCRKDFNLGV